MPASGTDLCGLQSFARVSRAGGVSHAHRNRRIRIFATVVVAELAIVVPSPGVGVSVAAQGQRMPASGTDLHVGEIRWQVRIRLGIRLPDHDRRGPIGGRPVAELAIPVVSPCVGVSVAAHRQGESIVAVSSSADLAESDALAGLVWRNDGGGSAAQLAALVRADAPRAVPAFSPFGGQGQVLGDGLAEIVGDAAGEPSVEQEAFARRVG